jgi:hypothetical protein
MPVPVLGGAPRRIIVDGYDDDDAQDDFHPAIRTFLTLERSALTAAASSIFAYYRDVMDDSCWLTDDLVLIAAVLDEERLDEDDVEALGPGELGVWSVSAANWRHRSRLDYRTGVLLPFGVNALSLYDYPKLISPTSGGVLAQWPDLSFGERELPYYPRPAAPLAVDPSADRFALADANSITVIAF